MIYRQRPAHARPPHCCTKLQSGSRLASIPNFWWFNAAKRVPSMQLRVFGGTSTRRICIWCTRPLFGDAVFGAAAPRQRVRIKAQRLGLELGALSQYEDSPPCHVLILSPTIGNIYIWDSPRPMHNILGSELAGTIICKLHI